MSKLNIKPIEAGISIHAAIAESLFFNESDLKIDLEEYRNELQNSFLSAVKISIEAEYITTETVKPLISRAQDNAMALATESEYLSTDTVSFVLTTAQSKAQLVANLAMKKGYVT
jgi:large subunit ribosomal protein L10